MKNLLLVNLFLFFSIMGTAQPRNMFDAENPDVHDPVMAKGEDGRYYIFSTGHGIGVMSSSDMKTWRREQPVFSVKYKPVERSTEQPKQRVRPQIDWDESTLPHWTVDSVAGFSGHIWAPDISFHNGLWHLYYSCSTFGKNGSAIGYATNRTLDVTSPDFKWEDHGCVIVSHKHIDNWNAIDPNLIFYKKAPYLTYGSFWDGIQLVKLGADMKTPVTRPQTISRRVGRKLTLAEIDNIEHYTIEGNDTIEAGENAVEAPFIIKRGKYYYLFVSFDYCCRGERSTYRTVYGRSKSVKGPFLDMNGQDMRFGGGTQVYGPDKENFGIGHCSAYEFDGKWWFVSHAYTKKQDGHAKLFVRELNYDDNGWIVQP